MSYPTFVPILYQITIGLLILIPTNAFASNFWSFLSGEFNAKQKIERIEMAKTIRANIDLLDSYLPNTRPSEIKWIDQERIAIDKLKDSDAKVERLRQFYESPEFQQQKLKGLLGNIKNSLDCIMSEKVSLKTEMLCWAITSNHLSDSFTFNDSIMILKKHAKLPNDIAKKADLTQELDYSSKYEWCARAIIEHIVIPYLAGKIK